MRDIRASCLRVPQHPSPTSKSNRQRSIIRVYDWVLRLKRQILQFRYLLFLLALIGLTWVVLTRFASLQDIAAALSRGRWDWITCAIALDVLYFVLYAWLYEFGFKVVEVKSQASRLMPIVFASIFVNTVAPVGGAGGAALFVDDAVRHHQSGARAAVGTVLVLLADLGTLVPFMIAGEGFLYSHGDLQLYDAIGGLVFLLFLGILTAAMILARVRPGLLLRWMSRLQRAINHVGGWFRHPNLISADWYERNAAELSQGADAIVHHPKELGQTLFMGFLLHVINLLGLAALFIAFQQPVDAGTLVAGFSLGIVFWVIGIIPAGTGIVESIMTLIFISRGIPNAAAVAITVAFRGLNFWLPLLVGLLLIPQMRTLLESGRSARPVSKESEG